jgi:hypothetical protein
MAMTAIDIRLPAARPAFGARAAAFFKGLVQGVALGRMVRALNQMSDDQLAKIGVKRVDIPAYARQLVLGG